MFASLLVVSHVQLKVSCHVVTPGEALVAVSTLVRLVPGVYAAVSSEVVDTRETFATVFALVWLGPLCMYLKVPLKVATAAEKLPTLIAFPPCF